MYKKIHMSEYLLGIASMEFLGLGLGLVGKNFLAGR